MRLIKYREEFKEGWDSFVDASKNGTIFHKQAFLSYHSKDKFEDGSVLFMDSKDKIMAVFPAAFQTKNNKKVLKSHPGSSYGGLVVSCGVGVSQVKDCIISIEDYAINEGATSIELRTSPRVFHKIPSEELDYILWYRGFDVVHVELSSAVKLNDYKDDYISLSLFKSDTARSSNKALKAGVIVKQTNLFEDYWFILSNNLETKHRALPTHTIEEIKKLKSIFPDEVRLYGAFYEGVLIAGTVVFCCNSRAYHTFYIAQNYDYQHLRPLNILFTELIKELKEEGIEYLNFGISTEYGGTAMNEGLFRFKEGFGARGVARRYYRKDLTNE